MMISYCCRVAAIVPFACLILSVFAFEGAAEFDHTARPIFEAKCITCHNDQTREGGLSLQSAEGLAAGGETGSIVSVANADASVLIQMVTGESPRMPRKGAPLTTEQVNQLRIWIDSGATFPDDIVLEDKFLAKTDWWSFLPLQRPIVPRTNAGSDRAGRFENPIDAFVAAKHVKMGLSLAPRADRRTLIRRVSVDLTGLLPTPQQVAAFVNDPDPLAYEKLIDHLLDSPRYGERWARHWLDVVHYADTHGYDKDKIRPNAWPYRDYVIRSLNQDKPYGRFVREQLAGDALYAHHLDSIVALGFIAAGPWDYVGHVELPESKVDGRKARHNDRDDMVMNAMSTFVSLTVHCAQCHDHKFDPITQDDYYALQAVFAGVDRADRPYDNDPDLRIRNRDGEQTLGQAARKQQGSPLSKMVYAATSRFAPQGSFLPTNGRPRKIHILHRGEVTQPRQLVGPGAVNAVLPLAGRFDLPQDHDESGRRAALAEWITHQDNPLVWRSIVNRVWQYHFGRGLVDTPNDFGRMGSEPTFPQLLDWLAVWFRDDAGQSIKSLHRLILTSSTYRQSSRRVKHFESIDSSNRFLWRFNRQKLDAEAIRDSILRVAGKLDLSMGGAGFKTFGIVDDHSPHYLYEEYDAEDPATWRRSIYRLIVRSVPDPWMTTLDCANPSLLVAKRNETLTALQALALMNNQFIIRMSEHFAQRIRRMANGLPGQIDAAFQIALCRDPLPEERRILLAVAEEHGLENVCRLILNTNEFLFVD